MQPSAPARPFSFPSIARMFGVLSLVVATQSIPAIGSGDSGEAASVGIVAEASAASPTDPFAGLEYRNVGPVNMSGRVADVEGVPGDPRTVWVGSASGGIWKSTTGGITFEPVFDDQPVASIGDIALAPSNPDVVWVGTGEGNPRNSVSFGKGVWRSTDGGASWQHVGLRDTRYITRIAVHPTDPDTAWVGALGSIWGPSEARGVYKTTDGGKNWKKVLYLDDRHGVSDLDLDLSNPKVLYAGLWHFERKPWTHRSGSEEGGVFRSVDGGETWVRLGGGLPKLIGRIGVKIAPSDPRVVYAMTESHEGTLYRSADRGETWAEVHGEPQIISRGLYYTDLRVDPRDENRVYAISSRLFVSIDGGKTFERISRSTHVDYHSLWIDPTDPNRIWQGQDGGVAVSYDRGATWEAVRNLPLAQFYQAFYDTREPFYYLGGGLQDNGAWYGPSRTREPAGILPDDWRMMSFGDAYFVVPHHEQVDLFLSEYQGGGILRTDMRTRQQVEINPQTRRGDGGPVADLEYRFNWNSPIIRSPHDPNRIYFAGNVVFVTEDFGDSWTRISPDLTTDDAEKQGVAGGPAWTENTTAEWHCTIISLAESPAAAGELWVGTDDGNLQLSRDGGQTWTDLTSSVEMPAFSPVSHVEPSRIDPAIAYVSFDRHMFGDYRPHILKTMDHGATWKRIGQGIAEDAWVWSLREDPLNPEVVYAGTELGLYVSFDGGEAWQPLHLGNLPTVAVHDIRVQPQANDLILGTHGRAIWVLDDLIPIQQWPAARDAMAQGPRAHLFDLRPALRFPVRFTRYGLGDKVSTAPNPPYGALITYYLAESFDSPGKDSGDGEASEAPASEATASGESPEAGGEAAAATDGSADEPAEARVRIEILDLQGEVIRTLDDVPTAEGFHRVAWDLSEDGPEPRTHDEQAGSDFRGPPRGARVVPGSYRVRLHADDEVHEAIVEVAVDPLVPVSDDALAAQHVAASEVVGLLGRINTLLRAMDHLKAELGSHGESLERMAASRQDWQPPEGLEERADAVREGLKQRMEELDKPEGKPFWSEGPRLLQSTSSLMSDLDSAFAAPTTAQMAFLAELREAVGAATDSWNAFLAEDVTSFDRALTDAGLPGLALPTGVAEGGSAEER